MTDQEILLAGAIEVLRGLEWSGRSMGHGYSSAACPVCHGIKPDPRQPLDEWAGHRDNCRLANLLEAV